MSRAAELSFITQTCLGGAVPFPICLIYIKLLFIIYLSLYVSFLGNSIVAVNMLALGVTDAQKFPIVGHYTK